MKLYEAVLAVECHALCRYNESVYYAYGINYTHRLFGKPTVSIELHDCKAVSVIYAPLAAVEVARWRLPDEDLKAALARYQAIFKDEFIQGEQ